MTFFPGEDVYYEHTGCKITGIKCEYNGEISISEDYDCDISSTTTSSPTSTTQTTTPPTRGPGCHYDGLFYNPGEMIYEVRHLDWCSGAVCSDDAKIIQWDNLQCNTTTTDKPTTITTTSLAIAGCVVEGEYYIPGELILKYQHKDECIETTCGWNGVEKKNKPGQC